MKTREDCVQGDVAQEYAWAHVPAVSLGTHPHRPWIDFCFVLFETSKESHAVWVDEYSVAEKAAVTSKLASFNMLTAELPFSESYGSLRA